MPAVQYNYAIPGGQTEREAHDIIRTELRRLLSAQSRYDAENKTGFMVRRFPSAEFRKEPDGTVTGIWPYKRN